MTTIISATCVADLSSARTLIVEYAASLNLDLSYQDFGREIATLPGDYAAPRGCLLLARSEGEATGCVGVRPLAEDVCEMKRLYVRLPARGSGLGRALAESAIAFARTAGYGAMRLDTLPSMGTAQALYRALGFREIAAYRASPVAGNLYLELPLRTST